MPASDARARVLERQDIREAIGIAAPIAMGVVAASIVLFTGQSLSRTLVAVGAIAALGLIWFMARGPLRRRPQVAAFALVVVILIGRLLPIALDLGTTNLTEAYFGMVVLASAVFLPWNLRWHGAWLAFAGGAYGAAVLTLPAMSSTGPREVVFVISAMVVSLAGSVMVRARRHRQLAAQRTLRVQRGELREAHARLRESAQEDPLTGLLNRRRLAEDIALMESRAARGMSAGLAALMVDLDSFKAYNDAFGHPAGDRLLSACAVATRAAVRTVDRVYRYGGEEILVLLEEDDADAAHLAAQRIVEAVRALNIAHPATRAGRMTVSVGSAASRGRLVGPWDVIDEADRALYDAKAEGRDRAVAFRFDSSVRAHEAEYARTAV
jgi:diguanylate cyclase (GGDEF)-like protein